MWTAHPDGASTKEQSLAFLMLYQSHLEQMNIRVVEVVSLYANAMDWSSVRQKVHDLAFVRLLRGKMHVQY